MSVRAGTIPVNRKITFRASDGRLVKAHLVPDGLQQGESFSATFI